MKTYICFNKSEEEVFVAMVTQNKEQADRFVKEQKGTFYKIYVNGCYYDSNRKIIKDNY